MGLIASAELDLNVVNDAYTVSLSNPVCAIHADFDGSNPNLSGAYTQITVKRSDISVPFTVQTITEEPNTVISKGSISEDRKVFSLGLTQIPTDVLDGYVALHIITDEGFQTDVTWRYTVLRESSMLDWIQDWESNKTKIGSSYVITPKLFVGKKIEKVSEDGQIEDKLTGRLYRP